MKYLDAANDLFVDAIARGRGTSKDTVSKEYGRGTTMFAADAKKRGMIDSIARPALRAVDGPSDDSIDASAANGGAPKKEEIMDLKKLKAEHADIYEAAVAEGVKQERERVVAHLIMAEPGGPDGMAVAVKAIKDGTGDTAPVRAEYFNVALKVRDVNNRQQESDAAAKATAGAAGVVTAEQQPAKDLGDLVAERVEAQLGITPKKVA